MSSDEVNTHKLVAIILTGFVLLFGFFGKSFVESFQRTDSEIRTLVRETKEERDKQMFVQWQQISDLKERVSRIEGFRDGFLKAKEFEYKYSK